MNREAGGGGDTCPPIFKNYRELVRIPISTRVVIFTLNSHKRKRNAENLTLMSRKTEETARVAIKFPMIFEKRLLC